MNKKIILEVEIEVVTEAEEVKEGVEEVVEADSIIIDPEIVILTKTTSHRNQIHGLIKVTCQLKLLQIHGLLITL